MKTTRNLGFAALAALLAAGCGATHHAADVREADAVDRVTVGTVQKEIRLGMSAADVATALGSPNTGQENSSRPTARHFRSLLNVCGAP